MAVGYIETMSGERGPDDLVLRFFFDANGTVDRVMGAQDALAFSCDYRVERSHPGDYDEDGPQMLLVPLWP
jgi:hypothetical protein